MSIIKRKINKKTLFIIIILLIIICTKGYRVMSIQGIGITPRAAIESRVMSWIDDWKVKRVISEINIDSKSKFVFYENFSNGIMHCYLEKKWYGMWAVVEASGQEPKEDEHRNMDLITCKCNDKWVFAGVIYNNKIKRMEFNGMEADIIDEGFIRFWFLVDNQDHNNLEVLGFYDNGQVIGPSVTGNE